MHEKVLELAKYITTAGEEELPLLDALCTAAEEELAGRLREDVQPEDCGVLFPLAAALTAAGDLLPFRGSGDVEQFTAGDVSVRLRKGGEQSASSLRRQAAALLSRYLRDGGFAFMGVRG